jgi:hypothetical protein
LLHRVIGYIAQAAKIATVPLADDVRVRRAGEHWFAFNYGGKSAIFDPNADGEIRYKPVVGTANLESAGIAVWKRE